MYPEERFKQGDVVRIITGGVYMTVEDFSNCSNKVQCVWFDKQDKLHREEFDMDALDKVLDYELQEEKPDLKAWERAVVVAAAALLVILIAWISAREQ